ncbi:hypothetical protein [Embleya sp. NBC_00896]|uniref:hypothetical protein n=1 Tax=Embleya sp. NBC_00896 TaxID=2975961 RepID=UPI0038651513|nr:hypothetical protein OG928_05320 [Embleya sp. NBC_00896]
MVTKRRVTSGVVVGLVVLGAGLSGCARHGRPADGGAAPAVTPPPVAVPLWPAVTPTWIRQTGPPAVDPDPIVVPIRPPASGDLRDADPAQILLADTLLGPETRARVEDCPDDCGLRAPMYRDLTGDGNAELIVAVDEPSGQTGLFAYTYLDGRIVHVLGVSGHLIAIETLGADVVIHELVHAPTDPECCPSLRYTTRYRWDGHEMRPILQGVGGEGSYSLPGDPEESNPATDIPSPPPANPNRTTP